MAAEEIKKVSIYKASAGSGKTFTLVMEYLGIVLRKPAAYRNVLAITFTNKAAGEMKSRILGSLGDLSAGRPSPFLTPLLKATGLAEDVLRSRAGEALGYILHNYGNFGVSTIDSFTYKLIRSFSRDLELPGRFDVELDTEGLLNRITDQLIDAIGRDEYITKILTQFVEEKLRDSESWNIEDNIRETAVHLFRETSKDNVARLRELEPSRFFSFIGYVQEQTKAYPLKIQGLASEAVEMIQAAGIPPEHFAGGSTGVGPALLKLQHEMPPADGAKIIESRIQQAVMTDKWISEKGKASAARIDHLLDNGLREKVQQLFSYHQENYQRYLTAIYAYSNIHSMAVLRQVEDLLDAHKDRHQLVHISDFQKKISDFLSREAPDYIYWRLGERYRHYLLDEFQDTSEVQWVNLFPLLEYLYADDTTPGSLLIVGDSKQAIYRWRGGSVELLERVVPHVLGVEPVPLDTNYRSHEEIVSFNNQFFSALTGIMDHNPLVAGIYENFSQQVKPGNEGSGYVEILFLKDPEKGFKELAGEQMLTTVARLLTENYCEGDIAVLVRSKAEGNLAANVLSDAGYRVISAESLLLCMEPAVNFMISLFRFLSNPGEPLPRAEVLHYLFYYIQQRENPSMYIRELLEGEKPRKEVLDQLPPDFRRLLNRMDQLPLYEMAEEIIRIFDLGKTSTGYLQHFLDVILEYSEKKKPDIPGFLEYWDEKKETFTVKVPEHENAIRIYTIHKSKGLEFPVVLIPYAEWNIMPSPRSILWTDENSGFGEQGQSYLIPFRKDLDKSMFTADYHNEIEKSILDNINLLYVAFTRPEERLYIFSPTVEKPKEDAAEYTSTSHLLHAVAQAVWPDRVDSDRVERGIPVPRQNKTVFPAAPDPEWISERWRDRIRVERKFHRYKDAFMEVEAEGTPFLILVREALKKMQTAGDLEKCLTTLKEEGMLDAERTEPLRTKLQRLLANEDLGKWYQPNGKVAVTPEIITAEGELLRPDKMFRSKEGCKILQFTQMDWETEDRLIVQRLGEQSAEGEKDVHAWLFFLDREKAEQVF